MSNPTQPTGITSSTHGPQVGGKAVTATPVGSTNPIVFRGDYAAWDTVANKFVTIDQTSVGTTAFPKL